MYSMRTVSLEIRTLWNLIRRCSDNAERNRCEDRIMGIHKWVLGFLFDHEDRDIYQKDIEEAFHVRRPTATVTLQGMERSELIRRIPVEHDARLKKIVLTEKAHALYERCIEELLSREKKIVEGISAEELNAFFSVLDKIKLNLENEENQLMEESSEKGSEVADL